MIYAKLTPNGFIKAFEEMGRSNQFSYGGLTSLYDYLNNLSDDTNEPLELDVIRLCCEYSEVTADECVKQFDIELGQDDNLTDVVSEHLQKRGIYCAAVDNDNSFIIINV